MEPAHYDRDKCSRMTSEERQVAQAQREVAEFLSEKRHWDAFYEDHIKPHAKVPFTEEIKSQQTWHPRRLTQVEPFKFKISSRLLSSHS